MSLEFHNTVRGQRFFDYELPRLTENIEKLHIELAKSNQLKEQELKLKEQEVTILTQQSPTP